MALSGTFLADFSDFYAACQKAEVSVKSIGEGAATVGTRLNTMVDQFSGRRLVAEATLLTRAIEEIGGVGKLTTAELGRVSAKAGEAVEKLQKMGQTVPKGLEQIAAAGKPINTGLKEMLGTLAPLAGAFGVTFSIGAVVGFAKSIMNTAGELKKFSAQTGISVEGLQTLQAAGDDTGNTIDEMSRAISTFQERMLTGDDSAVNALEQLGLQFENLKRLTPDQQFIRISDALRQVKDPALQAHLATELFGKTGREVLPTLKRGFDDLKDSVHGMSEGTVEDLDTASATLARWARNTGSAVAEVLVYLARLPGKIGIDPAEKERAREAAEYAASLKKAADEAERLFRAQNLPQGAAMPHAPMGDELRRLNDDLDFQRKQEVERREQVEKATKKEEDAQRKLNAELRQYNNFLVEREFQDEAERMTRVAAATAEAAKQQAALNTWIYNSSTSLERFVGIDFTPLKEGMLSWLPATGLEAGPSVFAGLGASLTKGMAASIMGALQGGGNVLQSVGATVGNILLDPKQSGIGGAITTQVGKLPGVIGSALGSVLPMVGTLLGPALELASKGIGKLLGKDEESKTVNPLRDQFIAAAGGLAELNTQAAGAGVTLANLLHADTVDEYNAAIEELTGAFGTQQAALDLVMQTAQRYGFTLEELGPALQRQELDQQAQQLYKDFQVLTSAGIDQVAITEKMAASVNAYVGEAVAMGVEVPEAMRPMLQQMADMGQLTDASGNKIENLEDSGVSFAMSMSAGFKSLIAEVSKLTDAIARGLGVAVDQTSSKLKGMPKQLPVEIVYRDPGFERVHDVEVRYSTPGGGLEGFQHGTDGYRNFGAGTPVMLHGWEAVVPREAASTAGVPLLGSGPAAAPVVVTIDARGALFNDPGSEQRLADRIQQALDAKHGLTHKRRAA
jgi:hypothetical protein